MQRDESIATGAHRDLQDARLTEVPEYIFTHPQRGDIESIDLSNNWISRLPDNFSDLRGLKFLNLARNRLLEFPSRALSSCTHLTNLNIDKNQIRNLDL